MPYEYSVKIGDVTYEMDRLRSVTLHRALFDKFSVGNAWAAEIEIQFQPNAEPPRMGRILPYVKKQDDGQGNEQDDEQSAESTQLGVYYIDERSSESGIMTLVGYDSMLKSGFTYGGSEEAEEWPRSMESVAEEISGRMGVEMDADLDNSLMMEYPDGYTGREILCGIAAAHGGNWIITNTGVLKLVPLEMSSNVVRIGSNALSLKTYTQQPPVSEVVVTIDDGTSVSKGSNDGSGYTLNVDCPFVTKETAETIAENLFNQLEGFVYYGMSAEAAKVPPSVNLGDTIEVGGHTCMLADQIITFSPGFYSDVSAPGENEVDHEYAYQGPSTTRMNRQQREIEEVPNRITLDAENDEDGKTASISLNVDGVPRSTATFVIHGNTYIDGKLTAESLYAAYGDVADLLVDRLSTSRRIPKYLAGNTADDQYIYIENQNIHFMAGIYNAEGGPNQNGEEQAVNPYGELLYWDSDPNGEGVFIGANGYPYTTNESGDTVPIYTTTDATDWPVMVYTYTEQEKASFGHELTGTDSGNTPIYTPTITLGAGNAQGTNQARIRKGTDGLEIMYTPNAHSDGTPRDDIGIKMYNDGEMDIIGYDFVKKIANEDALPADWMSQNRIFVISDEEESEEEPAEESGEETGN